MPPMPLGAMGPFFEGAQLPVWSIGPGRQDHGAVAGRRSRSHKAVALAGRHVRAQRRPAALHALLATRASISARAFEAKPLGPASGLRPVAQISSARSKPIIPRSRLLSNTLKTIPRSIGAATRTQVQDSRIVFAVSRRGTLQAVVVAPQRKDLRTRRRQGDVDRSRICTGPGPPPRRLRLLAAGRRSPRPCWRNASIRPRSRATTRRGSDS